MGTRRARQGGKNSVGETNLSSLDTMSNCSGKVGGEGEVFGLSERTTSCVGLGCKLAVRAEIISRVTPSYGVTACCCLVLFGMSLFASSAAPSTGKSWERFPAMAKMAYIPVPRSLIHHSHLHLSISSEKCFFLSRGHVSDHRQMDIPQRAQEAHDQVEPMDHLIFSSYQSKI